MHNKVIIVFYCFLLWCCQINGQYTRQLLSSSIEESIYLITWQPDTCSPIHSHAGTECTLYVVEGILQEELYRFPFADKLIQSQQLPANSNSHINDSIGMHRICNFSNTTVARSLHIYRYSLSYAL